MRVLSVNCGLPREVPWHGGTATTSIFKSPVDGRVALRTLNLDGDRQSDLSVHGGPHKAVYCYPQEHYAYWQAELPGFPLPMGVFGENFTTEGPREDTVHLGDRFSVGSAEVVVTQPRIPCYKLGIRFGMNDMVKRFLHSGRSGFYLAVTRQGDVGAGDELTPVSRDPEAVPIAEINRLYVTRHFTSEDISILRRAARVEAFPDSWKDYFLERLERAGTSTTSSS